MPYTLLLKFAQNPWVIMAISIAAITAYFKVIVWDLESEVTKKENTIGKLEVSVEKLNNNVNQISSINEINNNIIKEFQQDVVVLKENNDILVDSKIKEIIRLKKMIAEFQKPVLYTQEIKIKECKIKVKEVTDEDDTVFSSISNIGS